MYHRCKFINGCLAASIVCNYDITIVLSRNSAGGCHCITFSDSGRVPGTTEEDPPSPSTKWYQDSQWATERKRYQEYVFRSEPIAINTVLGRRGRGNINQGNK